MLRVLIHQGYKVQTGGTTNHLCLLNVRDKDLTGSKIEKVCDLAHITVNKVWLVSPAFSNYQNMIVGDTSALAPGGIRLGSPALTSRNMKGTSSFLSHSFSRARG